jgi:hypothetical protein
MAIVEVIGSLFRELATSPDLASDSTQTERQLNGLYDLLLERTLDLSSYVRTKVLSVLTKLCDLPVKFPKQRLAVTRAAVAALVLMALASAASVAQGTIYCRRRGGPGAGGDDREVEDGKWDHGANLVWRAGVTKTPAVQIRPAIGRVRACTDPVYGGTVNDKFVDVPTLPTHREQESAVGRMTKLAANTKFFGSNQKKRLGPLSSRFRVKNPSICR